MVNADELINRYADVRTECRATGFSAAGTVTEHIVTDHVTGSERHCAAQAGTFIHGRASFSVEDENYFSLSVD